VSDLRSTRNSSRGKDRGYLAGKKKKCMACHKGREKVQGRIAPSKVFGPNKKDCISGASISPDQRGGGGGGGANSSNWSEKERPSYAGVRFQPGDRKEGACCVGGPLRTIYLRPKKFNSLGGSTLSRRKPEGRLSRNQVVLGGEKTRGGAEISNAT